MGLGGLNPKSQATEMRGLMVRSIVLHEFNHKEGRIWDESSGHPREVAESRVRLAGVGASGDVLVRRGFGEDEEGGRVLKSCREDDACEDSDENQLVEDWLNEILGR